MEKVTRINKNLDKLTDEDNENLLNEEKDNEIRNKGDWESGLSEMIPVRGRERISIFKKLSNGLTPYEIMYGKQDNDYDLLNKSLE